MKSFEAWKREQLKKPEFKAAYDALEEEFVLLRKEIKARSKKPGAKRQQTGPTRVKRASRPGVPKTFGSRSR
jgi:hypothetical protein